MNIKQIIFFTILAITIFGTLFSIVYGFMHLEYHSVISGLYSLSVLGLLLMFTIEMSDGYMEKLKYRGLLIGLCVILLLLAICLLIGMFVIKYSWFMIILEILMVLLLINTLFKVLKRSAS